VSGPLEDGIKRWTEKRKSAVVIEIIQGKTTEAEAFQSYDLPPSEIENSAKNARKGRENALTNPLDVRQQYQKQLSDLQEAFAKHGKPKRLNTDQGNPFNSGAWIDLLTDPKISKVGKGVRRGSRMIEGL